MATKRYWFRAKKYGWGWWPSSWEGWIVSAVYIFLVFICSLINAPQSFSEKYLLLTILPGVLALSIIFIIICYITGEKPHWQWGDKKNKSKY